MRKLLHLLKRPVPALFAAALLLLGGAVAITPQAAAAATPPPGLSPVLQRGPDNVTADALPTVQIDGVVWREITVGNTVFAGGSFANARPAGAAPGTNLTPRANLLSFDITTGVLNTSFAPSLNGEVKALAVSPDGSRLYVGGSFTTVNGQNRYRIAAFDIATGQLISTWAPALDATVNSIAVTGNAVYVGGNFSMANSVARAHLAAFDPVSGALLGWAPTADDLVQALVVTPDGSRVVIGGNFQNINGSPAYGLGAVDATTGALYPWAANQVVRDAGAGASILTLYSDGTSIYSTAYVYGSTGNFEGVLSADPDTGQINWLADCHGDTYGTFVAHDTVYVASHQHFCANIGGFPDTNPRSVWHRATAFTTEATGTVATNGEPGTGYGNFAGQPSPSLINWLPDLTIGTYTGQSQAAWSVTGNSDYVVYGGEFPSVNNVAQQGLVRFAVPSLAPKKQGPMVTGPNVPVGLRALSGNVVRVSWQTNWDRDDQNLTYTVTRDGQSVYTTNYTSWSWNMPTIGFLDTGLSPGTTYTYRIKVNDPDGNYTLSSNYTVTTLSAGSAPLSAYAMDVLNAGATNYWRLDQASGATTNIDYGGFNDLSLKSGVTAGAAGAIVGDADTASAFNGSSSSGYGTTTTAVPGPNTFSVGAWFSTKTTSGGKIVGFGNASSGNSSNYDRQIYMDNSGYVYFGVYNNATYTIKSSGTYNDGKYHQVVGTLSSSGMALYIDGILVGTNTGTTVGQTYNGYWRVGGDNLGSWPGAPRSYYFNGTIDEVAVYSTALTLQQVRQQYLDSGRTQPGFVAPSDPYGAAVWNSSPSIYYRMDDTSGTVATDSSGNLANGTYIRGYTLGASSPVSGSAGTAVTFNGSTGTMTSGTQLPAPSVYTEEAWFNTTGTAGKIVGFGNSSTGTSTSTDRNVYLQPDGTVAFGVRVNGSNSVATSTKSYNDGKWHQVVATQGPDGMTLYVDGIAVGSNSQTQSSTFAGYWRIGGDSLSGFTSGSGYFNGTIDEVALYSTELTPSQVLAHYKASPAAVLTPPKASFTASANGALVSFDATGSTDVDGTIQTYAWDFGDGTSGTGSTTTHTYANSGTYTVKVTVTDDNGLADTASQSVTVNVTPPTASFTASVTGASLSVDGSTSSAPSGATITEYDWDFGDGTSGTGKTATHTYAASGSYQVKLTVTDDQGLTGSTTQSVAVVVPNKAPTAAFTDSPELLKVSFDGSGSSDPDGSIAGYAWDFGDGTTGTGQTTTHTYAQPGTYTVTLTVTDNDGATGTVSHSVAVTQIIASDSFSRTVSSGWGAADVGGAWTYVGGQSNFSVNGSQGLVKVSTAGTSATAFLNSVSATDVNMLVDASTNAMATGNGEYIVLIARRTAAQDYRLQLRLLPAGVVHLAWSRVVAGKETVVSEVLVKGLTYAAGDTLRVRFQLVSNTGGSTTLMGTVWNPATSSEPASPQIKGTDSTAALQGVAGGVGLYTGLASNETSAPVTISYDNLSIGPNSATPANQPPTAAFTAAVTGLGLSVDGSGSSDPDGSIASYAWNFGDGGTGSGKTATHTYAKAGTYTVTLTVTDNAGATGVTTKSVTVSAVNQPPVAAFTSTVNGSDVSFDASGSSDPDGSIASYAWDFGDGTTGTGQTVTHTYAASGTYNVTLTVTDNDQATADTTQSVVVPTTGVVASDSFSRTVSSGWGAADVGGAWTYVGGQSNFSVNGSQGLVKVSTPGASATAFLAGVSATDVNMLVDVSTDKAATGNGIYASLIARRTGTSDYRLQLRLLPAGVVHLAWSRVVAGKETVVSEVLVKGLTYAAGDTLRVRFQLVSNTGGSTTLMGTVWNPATSSEPASPQIKGTDSTAALQGVTGGVGLYTGIAGNETEAPVTVSYDNVAVKLQGAVV